MAYTTIDKSTDHFNTVKWDGNGSNRDITGVGFQPDFTWIKNTTAGYSHVLGNSLSGDNKFLNTSGESAESTDSDKFRTFVSDGIQVGTHNGVNASGSNYVAWNWKGGTAFSNDASATGIGTIDSTGNVNATAGFSVIHYTGIGGTNQSVAHGLGATPKVILIKNRTSSSYWCFTGPRFFSTTNTNMLYLQNGSGEADDTNINGNVTPSSTVFGVDDYGAVNTNTDNHIAWCFAEKKGYSKFGYFQGNGNSNGPFVYLGFKPAWILFKNTTGNQWGILDNKGDPFNTTNHRLHPNLSQEYNTGAGDVVDFLSNGFKCRSADGLENGAAPIVYMAFAENPFVTSTGVPGLAR